MVRFRDTNYGVDGSLNIINLQTGRAVKPCKKKNGYKQVCLYICKKKKYFYEHRVIAECLIPNPLGKLEINHIDGNPSNNKIDNLEWCTSSENQIHAFKCGLQVVKPLTGESNGRYKGVIYYRPSIGGEVKEIRALTDCLKFGFHQPSVHKVITGSLKSHKGFIFWREGTK